MNILGVLLILLGLAVFGALLFLHAPLEEPASPGKTPRPVPDEEFERTMRWTYRVAWFTKYGAIPTGLLLIGGGIWCLIPERPKRG